MQNNYNQAAIQKLVIARVQATNVLRKEKIGTECLLIALTKGDDEVAQVLRKHGLTPKRVTHGFLCLFGKGSFVHTAPKPFTRAADENLRRAHGVAQSYDDGYIEPVHIAIALFRNDEGPIRKILDFLDIDRGKIVDDLSALKPFMAIVEQIRA
ncbi:MAG: Clp protease N-terminal domain-containing protein [Candidatus Saccharibacteria bacterium]|nr:Clp protease N-terminal domain-containing protein [Candidatus Saccharibacteria bacterium]